MKSTDILIRKGTNNRYKVVFHGHWSDIENVDDPTDTDYVKWYGPGYVSADKGHAYVIEEKE